MNTPKNKIILATRGRSDNQTSIFAADDVSVGDLKAALSEWLFDNFDITDFYRDEVIADNGDCIATYFIKKTGGLGDSCVYERLITNTGNVEAPATGARCYLKEMADDELVYLVYGLTLNGCLEASSNDAVLGNNSPMIVIAWLEPSLRERGSFSIDRFATNDPVLVKVSKKEGDESLYSCQQKQIDFSGAYPYDLGLIDELDKNTINNSLLLSNEFMESFASTAMKKFQFGCKRSLQIKEHSDVGDSGDFKVYATSSLLQDNKSANLYYWRALNNHLFGNDHEVTLSCKKRSGKNPSSLVVAISDNNQARQTLSISIYQHKGTGLNDNSEWFTLRTSKETTERRFLMQSYYIHTCSDIAELINEMADTLKGHNNLYKNEAALNSLISGAFNDSGLLAA